MASPPQSALSPTIKCATCARPLTLDELETHVCSKSSSPTPTPPTPRAAPPSRASSPLAPGPGARSPSRASSSGDSGLRAGPTPIPQTPIRRAVSPLAPPNHQSPPSNAPRTPPARAPPSPTPAPLKRAATESINSDLRGTGGSRSGSRPSEDPQPPGSPRRSMTMPRMPRMRSDSSASSFVIDAFTANSRQSNHGVPGGGRDQDIPVLSLHIPDTESGGSAGRAGVGRRAFAAVAQAALIATSYSNNSYHDQPPPSPLSPHSPHHSQHYGFGPGSSSQYLDINGRGQSHLNFGCSPSQFGASIRFVFL